MDIHPNYCSPELIMSTNLSISLVEEEIGAVLKPAKHLTTNLF